jgi:hypothetical protein
LIQESHGEVSYADSTTVTLSKLLPKSGERFLFAYEYDFGDSWWHEVLFEGCLRATLGQRYPLCLEGERDCPPEVLGGIAGYRRFLQAIAEPERRQGQRYLTWVGGLFDPEEFDAEKATKRMIRGLPKWRETA